MSRHGGSLHYVRPDRIVRTGVLSPIVGYQPQNDVMMVTQEFTSGPASGMQLSGLGARMQLLGLGAPTIAERIAAPFRQLGLRIKAAIAAARANRLMLTAPASSTAIGVVARGPMAPVVHAAQAAPQLRAMHEMAQFLAARGTPAPGGIFTQRRWNTYFYSG